jgi:cell filamentation protein fic-related protein
MEEKDFSYKGLSMEEIIRHLAEFIAELWQIHAFSKGSTRVSAIFFIKYLESLGFSIQNNTFAENPLYFRNALVRANYTNLQKGIFGTTEYLELFLRNLLLNEQNLLDNESLHISVEIKKAEEERLAREREAKKEKERIAKELEAKKEEERIIRELEIRREVERVIKELEVKKLEEIIAREREVKKVEEKITEAHIIGDNVNTEKTVFAEELYRKERTERENRIAEKVKLATHKAVIECCDVKMQNDNENKESEKEHFIALLSLKSAEFSSKTISHIETLFEEFAFQKIFGRTAVIEILHLKNSGASKFLLNLLQAGIIENVSGYGKGKYKFKK